jgi:hypothetical protein
VRRKEQAQLGRLPGCLFSHFRDDSPLAARLILSFLSIVPMNVRFASRDLGTRNSLRNPPLFGLSSASSPRPRGVPHPPRAHHSTSIDEYPGGGRGLSSPCPRAERKKFHYVWSTLEAEARQGRRTFAQLGGYSKISPCL